LIAVGLILVGLGLVFCWFGHVETPGAVFGVSGLCVVDGPGRGFSGDRLGQRVESREMRRRAGAARAGMLSMRANERRRPRAVSGGDMQQSVAQRRGLGRDEVIGEQRRGRDRDGHH
jgi:hypothetical protein